MTSPATPATRTPRSAPSATPSGNASKAASAPSRSGALCTLPVLRALGAERPVGLVLFDSHTDLYRPYFGGAALTHGNPFARAVGEGLIDPARSIMIGIRGTGYDNADLEVAAEHGIRIVTIEELFDRGIPDVMTEARTIGTGPVYVSFDIDFVDPAYAPGTGTPEIGGPTSFQAQQAVRALQGLEIVGADLVEVSPPFDTGGVTAWLAASILFEILCVMVPATAADGPPLDSAPTAR